MTKEELLDRLKDIEWDDFEVKEASGGIPKSMWETVSAFSNTAGGWIILGVSETTYIALFRFARQGENAGYGIDKIMRWTKLTGLEVDFESDITSSTVTYPLPLLKSGQINNPKSGQINIDHLRQSVDITKDDIANTISKSGQINASKSGQNIDIPRGYKSGDESRMKIVEAMRNNPEISRKDLSKLLGISPSAIQRHLELLKDTGIIIRLGSDRKGLWRVLK